MSRRILWLDNDSPYTRPYVKALRRKGDEAKVVTTLTEAENLLASEPYDLLILDVMIPTHSENEDEAYPFNETDEGHKTGLVFYKRMKKRFGDNLPPVLVMTVRLDQGILDDFLEANLDKEHFSTKFQLREVPRFLDKVDACIRQSN